MLGKWGDWEGEPGEKSLGHQRKRYIMKEIVNTRVKYFWELNRIRTEHYPSKYSLGDLTWESFQWHNAVGSMTGVDSGGYMNRRNTENHFKDFYKKDTKHWSNRGTSDVGSSNVFTGWRIIQHHACCWGWSFKEGKVSDTEERICCKNSDRMGPVY